VQFRNLLGTLALAALTGACASTGATPRPFPVPGGRPHAGAPPTGSSRLKPDAYAITGTALALRGSPYRNGGSDPAGFDCSGFTQYVFGQHGVALPRAVSEQYQEGKAVRPDEVEAGDLLFFTTVAPGPTHVGIALGGDEFIHAPSSTGVVRVERLRAAYWAQRLIGARRVG
jgi:hypothetical protein